MTEHQEWQRIRDGINAAFHRTRQLGLNARHNRNKLRAEKVQTAILAAFEEIITDPQHPQNNDTDDTTARD